MNTEVRNIFVVGLDPFNLKFLRNRAPHKSRKTGKLYEVTIKVRVPGQERFVRRHQDGQPERAHLKVAIRDAFDAVEQELKLTARKLKCDIKNHDRPFRPGELHCHPPKAALPF